MGRWRGPVARAKRSTTLVALVEAEATEVASQPLASGLKGIQVKSKCVCVYVCMYVCVYIYI